MSVDLKTCKTCKIEKPINDFGKNSRLKLGVFHSCKVCINNKHTEYRKNNPNSAKLRKAWASNNRELMKEYNKKYLSNPKNRKKRQDLVRNYKRSRYATDTLYKLHQNIRSRLSGLFIETSQRTLELLGCSLEEYRRYLESKFEEGMSWENHKHDGWHIDHIIPISSFDLTNEEELMKALHYTNTQPLWAFDNLSKKDKLNWKRG